jgi:hypothetical protein
VSSVGVTTVRTASFSFSRTNRASGEDYKHGANHEINRLDNFVKRRHRVLEIVNERCNERACDTWYDNRAELASMKKTPARPFFRIVVRKRIAHPDNSTARLAMPQISDITSPVANIASQLTAVASQLTCVLPGFALVALTDVTLNFTAVGVYLSFVRANFACVIANFATIDDCTVMVPAPLRR